MRLTIMLFAGLRQRFGHPDLEVEVEPGARIAGLRRALAEQHPKLGSIDHCRFAVDQEFADETRSVEVGQEIALIPPVSGGTEATRSTLSSSPLELGDVIRAVEHRDAGGIATFTGNVREHSRGKTVVRLEYEAYEPMAVRAMDEIALAIEREIPGSRVAMAHRVGTLAVGETAVVIAASAPHRDEAFRACREAIERLKRDVPIWKKEVDAEGGEWLGQGP